MPRQPRIDFPGAIYATPSLLPDAHFHLVAATPEANLVEGMRWLLSAYPIALTSPQLFDHGLASQARLNSVPVRDVRNRETRLAVVIRRSWSILKGKAS
jgi:hypothetical protein